MRNKKVELLAPAGNAEAFYGAVHAGADAIYLGGNRFGARAYAENFSEDELVDCIRYAHLLGRKVYLTVNTLVKESEFSELYEYLMPYYRAGLDARTKPGSIPSCSSIFSISSISLMRCR